MRNFFTDEFIEEFKRHLNENRNFREAAENWSHDFSLEMTDEKHGEKRYLFIELQNGECVRIARQKSVKKGFEEENYLISASHKTWERFFIDELDPILAFKWWGFNVKGNMERLVRSIRILYELMGTLQKTHSSWLKQKNCL